MSGIIHGWLDEAARTNPLADVQSGYIPIHHPDTGRFVCSIDFRRGLMLVTDKGKRRIVDLAEYLHIQAQS